MKKDIKTNSQIRTEKENLVIENFTSVMKKLDNTFLIENEDVNEITPAQQKYVDRAAKKTNKPTKFRSDITAAKKMIDAGKSQKEVIEKYGVAAYNAVNAENEY